MKKTFLAYILVALGQICQAQVNNTHNLMPVPAQLTENGQPFVITTAFRVSVKGHPDVRLYAEASRFVRRLSNKTGIFLDKQGYVTTADTAIDAPLLIQVQRPGKLVLGEDEAYTITTTDKQVLVTAITDLGAIHALETLLQLVSTNNNGYYIPGVAINDRPRFGWRGLLLDVALHFMPVEVVKRTLDGMAAVKMNVLHLHLCNDQGFRVESKVFPRLQQVAADGVFYTQAQVREMVNYADQRGIRIVPEFVVPAHTTAILTAYPEYASVQRKYTLQRYFGVFDPVMDPTNEKLYPFLEKLYTEMASLFPDAYLHIGGDENTGKDWLNTPHIKAFMQAHGMAKYMDLQTYFNRRLLPIIRKTGKTMMGWDEILQPGVPKDIVIESWRGNDAYYSSLRQGYQAILSYGYYIDLIQPASYHYQNEPAPDSAHLTNEELKRILGGEATMWSELVTPLTVDSRIWPRTAAIAERLWSPKTVADVNDMYRRLDVVSLHLEALGLQHQLYKQVLLRQLANGSNTQALEVLVNVLEPLKIYERNEGDTMYTVFSPFTKLADLATPDQALPRLFAQQVYSYLAAPTPELEENIAKQLTLWRDNDTAFKQLLRNSPVLGEAAALSEHLAQLAAAGLEALNYLHSNTKAGAGWVQQKQATIAKARQQGGRCEIQVVDPVARLVAKAGE